MFLPVPKVYCGACMPRLLSMLVLCGLTIGCKEPTPTADSVDQSLVGSWVLAKEQTLPEQIAALKDAKILKNQGDIEDFERNFSTVFFQIELLETARFTCAMGDIIQRGEFSGYWSTKGDQISLRQTHEGDKKKSDRMQGRVADEQLHMIHITEGIELPYIFDRSPDFD